jgi:hypothetical protein
VDIQRSYTSGKPETSALGGCASGARKYNLVANRKKGGFLKSWK